MTAVNMPQVGQDIPTAKIVKWYKKAGDEVETGDVIATVESEKAAFDVEAEEGGILVNILYMEGDEAEVFKPIAYINGTGEKAVNDSASNTEIKVTAGEKPSAAYVKTAETEKLTDRNFLSPAVKRLIKEKNIDIAQLKGSGENNRITKKDVEQFLDKKTEKNEMKEDQEIKHGRIRKIVAKRLQESKQNIPHFYLFQDINVEALLKWRSGYNSNNNDRISITDLIIYKAAQALNDVPRLNCHVLDDRIIIKKDVNIGVAASLDDGLVVPVVPNTDKKNIKELSKEIKERVSNARAGKLALDAKGTFTITTLGMFGVQRFLPIINPPEGAILSVGTIYTKVIDVNSSLKSEKHITFGLACDHRGINGSEAGEFLKVFTHRIENDF